MRSLGRPNAQVNHGQGEYGTSDSNDPCVIWKKSAQNRMTRLSEDIGWPATKRRRSSHWNESVIAVAVDSDSSNKLVRIQGRGLEKAVGSGGEEGRRDGGVLFSRGQ
jgi:hypothetical protein